jgi:F0F1-type ATP synthase membrane subunit b/b'
MSLSGSFSGGSDIGRILDIVTSDARFVDRIKELNEAEAAARSIIESVGPAESIPVLHDKAKTALAEAERTLGQSRSEAASIIDKAKAEAAEVRNAASLALKDAEVQASSTIASAAKHLEDAKAQAEVIMSSANSEQLRVSSAAAALDERSKELDAALARYVAMQAEATAMRDKYEDKMNKTKLIWSGVSL